MAAEVANVALTDCGTPGRDVRATATLLQQADNSWTTYNLPSGFGLRSVGNSYNTLGVMSNGFLVFGGQASATCTDNIIWGQVNSCFFQPGTTTAAVFFDGG